LYWQIFAISARFRIVWWLTAAYTTISFGITWLSIFWQCGNPSDLTNLGECSYTCLCIQSSSRINNRSLRGSGSGPTH
jgi:hypothetical protein